MKFFLVGFVFLATVAYLNAELVEDDFLEDNPDLEKCKKERAKCLQAAGDDNKEKLKCYLQFRKCRPRPTRPRPSFVPPTSPPDYVVKCMKERRACIKAAGDEIKEKLKCVIAFKKCIKENKPSDRVMRSKPSVPDFVAKCRSEAKKCLASAGGDKDAVLKCKMGYFKCIRDNRPRPTPPQFLVKCREDLGKCLKAAGKDFKERVKCYYAFKKCVFENRPTRSPRPTKPESF